ncbi:MAG: cytochrome c [Deltaproteobacteria bacterium]|nr:cytochrome c [Deltaproteobacteria bacterium]
MTVLSFLLAWLFAIPLFAQAKGDAKRGQDLYLEKCVLCHGSQGEGWDWTKKVAKPPVSVPDLAQVVSKRSDEFLFEILKGGGEAVGQTRFMPPFGFQLSDQEVWDIVAYIRLLSRNKK